MVTATHIYPLPHPRTHTNTQTNKKLIDNSRQIHTVSHCRTPTNTPGIGCVPLRTGIHTHTHALRAHQSACLRISCCRGKSRPSSSDLCDCGHVAEAASQGVHLRGPGARSVTEVVYKENGCEHTGDLYTCDPQSEHDLPPKPPPAPFHGLSLFGRGHPLYLSSNSTMLTTATTSEARATAVAGVAASA